MLPSPGRDPGWDTSRLVSQWGQALWGEGREASCLVQVPRTGNILREQRITRHAPPPPAPVCLCPQLQAPLPSLGEPSPQALCLHPVTPSPPQLPHPRDIQYRLLPVAAKLGEVEGGPL